MLNHQRFVNDLYHRSLIGEQKAINKQQQLKNRGKPLAESVLRRRASLRSKRENGEF